MSISSTQLITTNTHLYLPVEIWGNRIATLLTFSEIVSLFFQTCHFLRTSRLAILRPMAVAEQELMQITPYQGLNLSLERIGSVWLRLSSGSLRTIRSSLAERPPIIYAAQFANASVLLNEQLIAFHEENDLLSLPAAPPVNDATPATLTMEDLMEDLIGAEESITRECLIARTFLDPGEAARCFSIIVFRKNPFLGEFRPISVVESQVWERAQIVLNHVPDDMRDLVYCHLARTTMHCSMVILANRFALHISNNNLRQLANRFALHISDNNLRQKMFVEIANVRVFERALKSLGGSNISKTFETDH